MPRDPGPPRGVVRQPEPPPFQHQRHAPPEALAGHVVHVWSIRWDLRGQAPWTQSTLPHPMPTFVFEQDCSSLVGVMTGRFTRTLEGVGAVLGVKLRIGAVQPLLGGSVRAITDRRIPLREVLGPEVDDLAAALPGLTDAQAVAGLTPLLVARLRPVPAEARRVEALVRLVEQQPGLTRVDALAAEAGCSPRTLQRRFRRWVGVGPKWVICRYRLHEALARAEAGPADHAALAHQLGYTDQAHFIHDFKALVGTTPAAYPVTGPS
ncbi:MAG: helix-turn-helix transcriptional regulator [Alphaproteobacteria bacterium]|nr:helix-turn-helix transcriptional regulator [Alphaproteobacteria bacterium]